MTIDAHAIGEYLTPDDNLTVMEDRGREDLRSGRVEGGAGGEIDILWFEGIDHGEIMLRLTARSD
jgi:hypothetical protein